MDSLGWIFFVLVFLIIVASNFLFIRTVKKITKIQLKHVLIFFFISIVTICIGMSLCLAFELFILMDLLNLQIDDTSHEARITLLLGVILTNCLLNTITIKIYLRKISKANKVKSNEIELIGKE